jgi:hypothetical protein
MAWRPKEEEKGEKTLSKKPTGNKLLKFILTAKLCRNLIVQAVYILLAKWIKTL